MTIIFFQERSGISIMTYHDVCNLYLGGGFKYFFFQPNPWGNDPI